VTIPSFRRQSAPKLGAKEGERVRKKEPFRGSRHERGYDAEWTKLAAKYKKAVRGRCEECARRGYLAFCDVVDHMIPITDRPERRLDWNMLDALCHTHHNGLKRRIEEYARKTGQIDLIPRWMKFPETRPAQFQIMKRGPLAELFDEDQGTAAD
jgi:5-methylcytosine-specific restriction endonuclease McrA